MQLRCKDKTLNSLGILSLFSLRIMQNHIYMRRQHKVINFTDAHVYRHRVTTVI